MKYMNRWLFSKAAEDDIGGGGDDANNDAGNDSNVENIWPDNWRESYAGEDEKKLSRLSSYASPNAAFDAMLSAQNKISSGDFKEVLPFPVDGKDEEKADWRKNNGIPESAEKYDLTFEDGLTIGEDDKPVIDDFLKAAFEGNMSPESAKDAVKWYYDNQTKQEEARAEADAQTSQETQDALRAEWGNDYRPNINRIHGLLDTAPEGVKDKIMNGRLEDGTPIASDQDTLKFFIDLALQVNPATTLVPGSGGNVVGALEDEIKSIEAMMSSKTSEYWKGPKSDDMQKRYRELITARDKMK